MDQTKRGIAGTRLLQRFGRDRGGAIAPLAAVVITAGLIGGLGAIDISRLVTARTQLQDAVDSADLALARMPQSTSDADMQAKAKAWIVANVTDPNVENLTVATPVRSLGQIQLNVTADIKTTSAALLGVPTLPIQAHSTVKYGTTHVELALVLDNTGSMNDDNKLSSLKSAATTLVDTLNQSAKASGDPNALKVAVVPFSMTVNVGTQYQTAAWMSGSVPTGYGTNSDAVDSTRPNRFTLLKNMNVNWGGCVESRPQPYDVQETAPVTTDPTSATLFVPFFAPDEPDDGYYQANVLGSTQTLYNYGSYANGQADNWSKSPVFYGTKYPVYSENNYLPDQISGETANTNSSSTPWSWSYTNPKSGATKHHQNINSTKNKYTGTPASGTSVVWGNPIGPNAGCTVQPLQRLTTDTSSIDTQINNMVAGGDTEIPLGLMWGWHVLSPLGPFADGTAYGTAGVIKVIVLVTDGANTYNTSININQSHYTAYGYADQKRIGDGTAGGVQSALNQRLQTLCANMKTRNADGSWKINIYTVPLEVTDTNIKSLLQGCVTDPGNYLDVASSSQLADAFANIAGSISALRVAH